MLWRAKSLDLEITQNSPADGTQTTYSYHSFSHCHIDEEKNNECNNIFSENDLKLTCIE